MEVNGMEQQMEKRGPQTKSPDNIVQKEYEILEDIMIKEEKVEKLNRQIRENKKAINHIEKSNTWKLSKVFREIQHFFSRLFHSKKRIAQYNSIELLEKQLEETKLQLLEAKEQVYELQIKDSELNSNQIYEHIREMKKEGELIQYIDTFIDEKNQRQKNYQEALIYAARLYMNKDETFKNVLYSKILSGLSIEEIPEFMIRQGLTDQSIPLRQASSFRGSLTMRMREKQLSDTLPEWQLDDKRLAYDFVEKIGIIKPSIDDAHYTIETIPQREGIVIKPSDGAGSRGVYLVHQMDDIFDVKKSIKLTSWDKLMDSMQQDIESNAVEKDDWIIEQLMYENKAEKTPARDVKFYCFYGKVGIILEIVRDPEVRQCWWTANGKRVSTGKYDESLFHGIGVTEEELHMAQTISEKIPAPFIRIDFLRSEDGLVFGEFTPKPGNYDEFDEATDKWLGDYFLEAQGRLSDDLLNGKDFTEYKDFIYNKEQTEVK